MAKISLNIPDKEQEQIMSSLESLGLHQNEIYIYLDLLKFPNASALDIAKKTGIHRSNTYDALRSLTEKGFIEEQIKENKKSFIAINPENLKGFMKEKQKQLSGAIETLKSSSNQNKLEEGVTIIKGAITLREEIHELIHLDKPILISGADEKLVELLTEEFLREFEQTASKDDVPVKIICVCPQGKCKNIKVLKNFQTKHQHLKKNPETAVIICDDIILHLLYKNPPEAIKIKNKAITDAHAEDFGVVWNNLK
ncbi:MAG: TrmB family transcriptional regulator [Nanoarchaeota archaeon]